MKRTAYWIPFLLIGVLLSACLAPPALTPESTPTPPPTKRVQNTPPGVQITVVPLTESESPALATSSMGGYPPSTGGTNVVNDQPYDAVFFQNYGVNPFLDTEDDHLSTFAMDVDTASYTVARRFLNDGYLPDPDSVRVEEFVNYFQYGYEPPESGVFAIHLQGAPSPFGNERHWLMRVGLQAKEIPAEERKDATLIFVIDVSGSMEMENRLGLVKRTLNVLVDELRPTDEVGIVVYGSEGRVILEPTPALYPERILGAIAELRPEGATNAEEGLVLAYRMAMETMRPDRITRLILCSDGVANIGNTGSDSILERIRAYVDEGITLSTVGFGMGNYNDILMEQLANDGDGNYYYVDTLSEARRVFVENLTGTLQVVARDAKIQVDFNPAVVSRYRLLGYENRRIADEDFRNDDVDAGEVGAGHSVTALYELKFHPEAQGLAATVSIRYQDPETGEVSEVSQAIDQSAFHTTLADSSADFQFTAAVAEFAEILRQSYWAQEGDLADVLALVNQATADWAPADVEELRDLIMQAMELQE